MGVSLCLRGIVDVKLEMCGASNRERERERERERDHVFGPGGTTLAPLNLRKYLRRKCLRRLSHFCCMGANGQCHNCKDAHRYTS